MPNPTDPTDPRGLRGPSQTLGFVQGFLPALDSLAQPAQALGHVPGLNGAEADFAKWLLGVHDYVAKQQASGQRPGLMGRVAGETLTGSDLGAIQPPAADSVLSQPAGYVMQDALHRFAPALVSDPGPAPSRPRSFGFAPAGRQMGAAR